MKRLALALWLLAAPLAADTVIFTETCSSANVALPSSTTVTVGTAWSSRITLAGSPATDINSVGSGICSPAASATDIGIAYTATPAPTTDTYYADFQWIDGGAISSTETIGMVVNYIDTSNYYACIFSDDTTTGTARIVKVSGGVGSLLSTLTLSTAALLPTNDVVECRIDYTGASPILSLRNTTDAFLYGVVTDTSSPLTETKKAGIMAGATPQATGDDVATGNDLNTFRVVEVTDTLIFLEQCGTNPEAVLPSSTTVSIGTSWGSRVTLDGSPATETYSGMATQTACALNTGTEADLGYGYIVSPAPTTNVYYADFKWIDGGNVGAEQAVGFLLNYIDASNYYGCYLLDDAAGGAVKVIKVSGGSGSSLGSTTHGGTNANDILECRIDYSGGSPTITWKNVTEATTWVSVTDSSSPLTKTKAVGVLQGATPETTTLDVSSTQRFDDFRVWTVPDAAPPPPGNAPRPPWFGRPF